MRKIDLTGQRFGRLTVLCEAPKKGIRIAWHCLCDCGKTTDVVASSLRRGITKSCGCYRDTCPTNPRSKKHGQTKTRLYRIWIHMKERCLAPYHNSYKSYGGRGITICNEWLSDFEAFRDWAIANGYHSDLTLDRIDVNGNYCPDNCRWVTMAEQAFNKRTNVMHKGKCITQWAREVGTNSGTVLARIRKGWPIEEAIYAPLQPGKRRKHA